MTTTPSPRRASRLRQVDIGDLMRDPTRVRRPALLWRTDGEPLLYPGAIHSLHAEPAAGKTWVALAILAQVLAEERPAVLLDFEGTGTSAAGRLRALGVDPSRASTSLRYLQPDGPVELAEVDHLRRVADGATVVVLDSVAEAMAQRGFDENVASDVTRWIDGVPRPLARDGAAVLLVDHVVKAADGRGRWARGSGAKMAAVDAAFELRSVRSFSRQGSGAARLIVAKDRERFVGAVGDVAAEVAFDVRMGGDEVQIRLDPPSEGNGERRVTDLHWVAERCREDGGWPSFADAVAALGMKERQGREVLRRAVAAGLLDEGRGPGAARRYRPAVDTEPTEADEEEW